jgi:hypothetical protein
MAFVFDSLLGHVIIQGVPKTLKVLKIIYIAIISPRTKMTSFVNS